jgi:hypothetical protein
MKPLPPADDEDDLPEADDFDPTEVFTMEDFLAEDEILKEFVNKIGDGLKADIEGGTSSVTRRQLQSGPRNRTHMATLWTQRKFIDINSSIIFDLWGRRHMLYDL